jgi:transposase
LIREYFGPNVTTEAWKMRHTSGTHEDLGKKILKEIKRATSEHHSSEENIRIVLDGLRGEDNITKAC